ncbi:hypothetical protein BJ912DRAFT_822020, partial [Pholiota molesta]
CAFENCTKDLKNALGGAFCRQHEIEYGIRCHIVGCNEDCEPNTLACHQHAPEWRRHKASKSKSTIHGIRRIIQ